MIGEGEEQGWPSKGPSSGAGALNMYVSPYNGKMLVYAKRRLIYQMAKSCLF